MPGRERPAPVRYALTPSRPAVPLAVPGGTTAGYVDVTERVSERLPWLIGAVVLLPTGATVARLMLVPAVMTLCGDRAGRSPRWLDRIAPRVELGETEPAPVPQQPAHR